MNLQKAFWSADATGVRLTMPLGKVDRENRIVSGFATLDNVDTSDDVVLSSASVEAFASFRGNIRLMHQPIPAGKLVNFREEEYYDAETQKFYRGIYVDVYVSKGAQDIWEMVLDGTLTGFSIGGNITEQESQYVADAGKVIRFIKAYDLVELSLVDSPANQLSNIFSITKTAGGTELSGPLSEVVAENVFWCGTDKIAFPSQDESKDCTRCGGTTENIGWFESDGGDKTEKVNAVVASFEKAETVEGRENIMADEIIEVTEEVVEAPEVVEEEVVETDAEVTEEEAPVEEVVETEEVADDAEAEVVEETADEASEEIVEDAAEVVEEEEVVVEKAETPDFGAMFAELSDSIQKALEASADATAEQLVKVNDKIAAIEAVATKIDELATKQASLEEKFNNVASQVEGVEKALGAVEKGVGIKKSGDLGGSKEETKLSKAKDSIWGGRFFGSVDNI